MTRGSNYEISFVYGQPVSNREALPSPRIVLQRILGLKIQKFVNKCTSNVQFVVLHSIIRVYNKFPNIGENKLSENSQIQQVEILDESNYCGDYCEIVNY